MSLAAAGDGTLTIAVWPAYVGACQADPGLGPVAYGEPQATQYQRGQIQWGMEKDDIVGRAFIHAGPGRYTHLAYFRGPEGSCMCGENPAATSNSVPTARRDRGLPDHQFGSAIAEGAGLSMIPHPFIIKPVGE
jgi:hypothetical protein